MATIGPDPRRGQLAEALKRLLVTSPLSGRALAAEIGIDQSAVSRIANNQQRATVQQVLAWCRATGADATRTAELVALAEDILVGPAGFGADYQDEVADLEAKAGTVDNYQPAALPGLAQTAGYARRLYSSSPFPMPDLDARVLRRIERQRVLSDRSKSHRFVIPEAVLRWQIGPADEHLEQLDHLAGLLRRPHVEIGIIPLGPPEPDVPPPWRLHGFVLYDDIPDGEPFVHVELLTRGINVFEPDQVETYRHAFQRLCEAAVFDDAAGELIDRVVEDLRRHS